MDHVVAEGALLDRLKASLDPVTPVCLLIDPLQAEPLPLEQQPRTMEQVQALREKAWQREVARLPLNARIKLPQHQHPYVVQLSGVDDPWIDVALELAQAERTEAQADGLQGAGGAAHAMGGWLQTSLYPKQLAEELAQLMNLHVIDCPSVQASYLRVADRRVLGLLRAAVGDQRISAALHRVQRWIYLDVLGRLNTVTGSGEAGAPLRLSYDEWLQIKPGERIQRAMAMWLGELAKRQPGSLTLHRSEAALYAAVPSALAAAASAATLWGHRFQQERDHHVWSALSLLHPELLRVPTDCNRVNLLMRNEGTTEEPAEPVQYMHGEIAELLLKGAASRRKEQELKPSEALTARNGDSALPLREEL